MTFLQSVIIPNNFENYSVDDGNRNFQCSLSEAVDQIGTVAIHINENIRQHENYQKMLSIQNSFIREGSPKILAPGKL